MAYDDAAQVRATLTDQWHKLIEVSEGVARIEVKVDSHSLMLGSIQQTEGKQNERLLTIELRARMHTRFIAMIAAITSASVTVILAAVLRHMGW